MSAHESFASLDEAAAEISTYLPHRKEVRPESLSRNLRQRPDGRWIWKHGLGRRWKPEDDDGPEIPEWRDILEGLAEDAASLQCPVLVLRGGNSDVLSDQGAVEIAELIPDGRTSAPSPTPATWRPATTPSRRSAWSAPSYEIGPAVSVMRPSA